jgi:hypothetical protein
MGDHHILAGLILLVATLGVLGVKYSRVPRRASLRPWGWMGLAIILLAELLLELRVYWVTIYFTPLAWTGYLLLVDGLVASLRGQSRLTCAPREFLGLPLWLIFEAYNIRLQNWSYVGLPESAVLRGLGYAWSFATIWPAIFETADLVRALGFFPSGGRHKWSSSVALRASACSAGLVLLAVPLLVPATLARYLFGAVWLGYVLLLDPLNYRWGGRSLLGELEKGRVSTLYSLLLSGWVCGIIWEFWNYWAAARWVYIFPIGQNAKIFAMPWPGFLGFPPFALECWVMYEFVLTAHRRFFRPQTVARWEEAGFEA